MIIERIVQMVKDLVLNKRVWDLVLPKEEVVFRAALAALVVALAVVSYTWLGIDTRIPMADQAVHLTTSLQYYYEFFRHPSPHSLWQMWAGYYRYYPPLYYLVASPIYLLFGLEADTVIFWENLLWMIILLTSAYALGKALYSRTAGIVAALLLSSYPMTLWLLTEYYIEIATLAMTSLAAYLLVRSHFLRDRRYSLYFGLAMALGALTKWVFGIYMLGTIVYVLLLVPGDWYRAYQERIASKRFPERGESLPKGAATGRLLNIGLALLAFLVSAAPWYLVNFKNLMINLRGYSSLTRAQAITIDSIANRLSVLEHLIYSPYFWLFGIAFLITLFSIRSLRGSALFLILSFAIPILFLAGTHWGPDPRMMAPLLPYCAVITGGLVARFWVPFKRTLVIAMAGLGLAYVVLTKFGVPALTEELNFKVLARDFLVYHQDGSPYHATSQARREDWRGGEILDRIEQDALSRGIENAPLLVELSDRSSMALFRFTWPNISYEAGMRAFQGQKPTVEPIVVAMHEKPGRALYWLTLSQSSERLQQELVPRGMPQEWFGQMSDEAFRQKLEEKLDKKERTITRLGDYPLPDGWTAHLVYLGIPHTISENNEVYSGKWGYPSITYYLKMDRRRERILEIDYFNKVGRYARVYVNDKPIAFIEGNDEFGKLSTAKMPIPPSYGDVLKVTLASDNKEQQFGFFRLALRLPSHLLLADNFDAVTAESLLVAGQPATCFWIEPAIGTALPHRANRIMVHTSLVRNKNVASAEKINTSTGTKTFLYNGVSVGENQASQVVYKVEAKEAFRDVVLELKGSNQNLLEVNVSNDDHQYAPVLSAPPGLVSGRYNLGPEVRSQKAFYLALYFQGTPALRTLVSDIKLEAVMEGAINGSTLLDTSLPQEGAFDFLSRRTRALTVQRDNVHSVTQKGDTYLFNGVDAGGHDWTVRPSELVYKVEIPRAMGSASLSILAESSNLFEVYLGPDDQHYQLLYSAPQGSIRWQQDLSEEAKGKEAFYIKLRYQGSREKGWTNLYEVRLEGYELFTKGEAGV